MPFLLVTQHQQPGTVPLDGAKALLGVLGGAQNPEALFLGHLKSPLQIGLNDERHVLHAPGSDVVNRGGERSGAILGENDALDPEKRGRAEDRTHVLRVREAVEREP